jgi:hypothetical protein
VPKDAAERSQQLLFVAGDSNLSGLEIAFVGCVGSSNGTRAVAGLRCNLPPRFCAARVGPTVDMSGSGPDTVPRFGRELLLLSRGRPAANVWMLLRSVLRKNWSHAQSN